MHADERLETTSQPLLREHYGLSYVHVGADVEDAAPIVGRLEGR